MLAINDNLTIPDADLKFDFVRSSGPGGQNVNKVATAAQLRFDFGQANYLPEAVRLRLRKLAGRRATAAGVLIITARRFRTQDKNRQDALERLRNLLLKALVEPQPRRPRKLSRAAREKRLREKRRKSEKKQRRQTPSDPEGV